MRFNRFDNSILSFVEGFSSLKLLYLDYNRLEGLIDLKGWFFYILIFSLLNLISKEHNFCFVL
jgi:hypothetical protein